MKEHLDSIMEVGISSSIQDTQNLHPKQHHGNSGKSHCVSLLVMVLHPHGDVGEDRTMRGSGTDYPSVGYIDEREEGHFWPSFYLNISNETTTRMLCLANNSHERQIISKS